MATVSADDVQKVFEAWRARQASPDRVRLTADRLDLIEARLRRGYSADEIVLLVRYAYEADTPEARFWRGDGGGRVYLGLDNLLRSSKLSDRLDRARAWADVRDEDEDEDEVRLTGIGQLRCSS